MNRAYDSVGKIEDIQRTTFIQMHSFLLSVVTFSLGNRFNKELVHIIGYHFGPIVIILFGQNNSNNYVKNL